MRARLVRILIASAFAVLAVAAVGAPAQANFWDESIDPANFWDESVDPANYWGD